MKLITEKLENNEAITLQEGVIHIEMEVPADMIGVLLRGLRDIQADTDNEFMWEFFQQLGEEIAIEYLEGDLEFDEPTADVAQWFLPES